MNILVLDKDPVLAAQYHSDQDVKRYILHYAKLLSTCHRVLNDRLPEDKRRNVDGLEECEQEHHPISIWVRQSPANYRWLYRLFKALAQEYEFRFEYKSVIWKRMGNRLGELPAFPVTLGKLTPFIQEVPERFKIYPGEKGSKNPTLDAVEAYRKFYIMDQNNIKRTKRGQVWWW